MDLMQLKMPPEQVRILLNAAEQHMADHPFTPQITDLSRICFWLRYRLSRWEASHPAPPAA